MACESDRSPALTNETVITVVADDDCTAQVTIVPVSIPLRRLSVIRPNIYVLDSVLPFFVASRSLSSFRR